eukprot:TRINITY_DN944_c0_g1_i2.p1 TRINITY_DN944_c0_g1~~TRINITY_DN944_c0_g1_i2.p1  ORF type:complete len:191 (+),score=31.25 TRINITY_DN944_c0_g1_i2:30-575(+)
MTRHLLLISSSRLHGTAYLEHCRDAIRVFLEADHVQRVLFIPYALKDMDAYEEKAKAAFAEAGFELTSVHREESPRDAIMQAQAVFVGGGNTFRLLKLLYEHDLIKILRCVCGGGGGCLCIHPPFTEQRACPKWNVALYWNECGDKCGHSFHSHDERYAHCAAAILSCFESRVFQHQSSFH